MWIKIVIQVVVTALEQFSNQDVYDQIWQIWSKYVINAIPLIVYPILYCLLRKSYLALIENQRHYILEEDIAHVHNALKEVGLFFIAIA